MIELIYKCDVCDERAHEEQCYKVYFEGGKRTPILVSKMQNYVKWGEVRNGRIVCFGCVKAIKAMIHN